MRKTEKTHSVLQLATSWRLWVMIAALMTIAGCDSPTAVEEAVTLPGIDISHHNIDNYGEIDWPQVRNAGYTFAFVKATDGYNACWTDSTFVTNMEQGHRAGVLMGAYHYARPDLNQDATVEAECFLQVAGPYLGAGYLRPVLDIETGSWLGNTVLTDWVHVWMRTVKERTGIEPILYTYSRFTRNFDLSVTQYNLWIAHYTHDPAIPPNPGIWERWDFWQYTDQGSVPGVGDPTIDLNLFNGSLSRLLAEFVN